MKMFSKIHMQSEYLANMLKDCYFQASSADAAVEDGALVVIGDVRANDLYGTPDLNARNCAAYAGEAKPIFGFVDYVGVNQAELYQGTTNSVLYRVGDKLAGVAPAKGEGTRVRMLALGDEFYLGDGNFDVTVEALGVGKYAYPASGQTTVKVSATAPTATTTGLCLKIEAERDLIMGQVNEGSKLYRCRVIAL